MGVCRASSDKKQYHPRTPPQGRRRGEWVDMMRRRTEGSVRAGAGRDAAETAAGGVGGDPRGTARRVALAYFGAGVGTFVALGLMALLRRIHDVDAPFLVALVPVVFGCWLGGLGPGLFAATLV